MKNIIKKSAKRWKDFISLPANVFSTKIDWQYIPQHEEVNKTTSSEMEAFNRK